MSGGGVVAGGPLGPVSPAEYGSFGPGDEAHLFDTSGSTELMEDAPNRSPSTLKYPELLLTSTVPRLPTVAG